MRYEAPESNYMAQYYSLTHPALEKIKSELEKDQLDFMSVSPVEARFLQFLVEGFNVKTIVEIGSLYGYSAAAMGLSLPSDGKIYCFEKDEARSQRIAENLRKSSLKCEFEVFSGDALESLRKIEQQGPFDLVFIDANKNAYVEYLNWAESNTKKGSLIVGDNTFLFGALWGDSRSSNVSQKQIETMNEFNRRLSDQAKYRSIMIPTQEGMTVAQRRV